MNYFRLIRELPKENHILFISTLIQRSGGIALIFLSFYLHKSLGYPLSIVANILFTYGLGQFIGSLIGALIINHLGAIRTIVITYSISSVILLIFPAYQSIIPIIVFTFLWSMMSGCASPAQLVAVSYFCNPEQLKPAYTVNRLAINLGMSIGPSIGGLLAHFNFKSIFYTNALALILTAAFQLYYFRNHIFRKKDTISITQQSSILAIVKELQSPKLIFILTLFAFVGMIFFQSNSTLTIFLVEHLHMNIYICGIMFNINTILIALFELPLNLVTNKLKHTYALMLGAFMICTGFGMIAFVTNLWQLIITIVIWSFGEMLFFPSMTAYLSTIAPKDKQALYLSSYTSTTYLVMMLGPFIGTKIFATYGPKYLWLSCLFLGLICTIFYYFIPSKRNY